ncbi:hypothetical protein ACOQFV_24415 [Nocardiopsis changdeensis]|uniref:Uncharacterized protein n=1 Tax=Nocardiopsis changdeensis TaxID=2831969 RepID=A0A975KT20_9ACTN|nr:MULTISPECIES: hypothetical protein [Nocardiopsis]QUX26465.1 hypothetical protein KGD84_32725 [Nocardiopsis changdeensis]QYX40737.1 hypothetical protein K1J57_32575 [Nocardiopsis sp. MT53]
MTTTTEITTAALLAAAARGGLPAIAALAGVRVARSEATTTAQHVWGEPVADWTEAAQLAARVGDLAHRAGYQVTDEWPKPGVIGYQGRPHAEVSVIDRFAHREEDGSLYRWECVTPWEVRTGDILRTRSGPVVVRAGVPEEAVSAFPVGRTGGWEEVVYRRVSATLEG